jgi:cell division protein FtsA
MNLVAKELETAGEMGKLGAGAVLTGGGAALAGAADVAQHAFGMPVRTGVPGQGLTGLIDAVGKPQFATATGLTLLGAERIAESGFGVSFGDSLVARLAAWIREFF